MWAEIISVGSELLSWDKAETNSLYLSKQLKLLGLEVRYKSIVGDIESDIESALITAAGRSSFVVVTGGLGPTEDDLTRKAVAKALKRGLVLSDALIEKIKTRFEAVGKEMPKNNERQALIPNKAIIIDNPIGTAPGFALEHNKSLVICLPGVPSEMQRMFEEGVLPLIKGRIEGPGTIEARIIRICGIAEAKIDEIIGDLYAAERGVRIGLTADEYGVDVRITSAGLSDAEAAKRVDELKEKIAARLKDNIYSFNEEAMEAIVVRLLKEKGARLSVAESCTGGLIQKRITDVSGSSACFEMGVVCYSNEAKMQVLRVPPEMIKEYGSVSSQAAMAMADGIRRIAGTGYGLGITGIAGPEGGTEKKPVGLVYIALSEKGKEMRCKGYNFTGSREMIRIKASQFALDMIRRTLLKLQ
ncbi:MAG: competence/damage-inducible protein A [Nitrospirae bacterium]|nr:competence/damage-inducible protein A [Nitrospirota bacterium]